MLAIVYSAPGEGGTRAPRFQIISEGACKLLKTMERETGIEPATNSLEG